MSGRTFGTLYFQNNWALNFFLLQFILLICFVGPRKKGKRRKKERRKERTKKKKKKKKKKKRKVYN